MTLKLFFLSILILTFLMILLLGCNLTNDTAQGTIIPENITRQTEILDFSFEDITINIGGTIIWTNRDSNVHTSTSGVPPKSDGLWDSPFLNENDQFSHTFDQSGIFYYWCKVHPFMTGTVTVEEPDQAALVVIPIHYSLLCLDNL